MKIINPLINANINLTRKGFFYSSSSRNCKTLSVEESEEQIDFTIERARAAHIFWIKQICEVTLSAAVERGTGISGRSAELLETKMKKERQS